MRSFLTILAVAALGSSLSLFGATASSATTDSIRALPQNPASGLPAVESVGEYEDTPTVRQLKELVGTQSQDQIDALVNSAEPVQILMDRDGRAIAAMRDSGSRFVPYVSPVGAGCSTTSACLRGNNNRPYGWTGGGSIRANVPNATSGFGGSDGYNTGFYSGKALFFARQGATVKIPRVTITSVSRTR